MKKKTTKKIVKAGVGLSLAAAAAALAGSYFVYGKRAAAHRAQARSWALKAKAEVLEQLENAKEITEPLYEKALATVSRKYKAMKHIDARDVEILIAELKNHWKNIKKDLVTTKKPAKKSKK